MYLLARSLSGQDRESPLGAGDPAIGSRIAGRSSARRRSPRRSARPSRRWRIPTALELLNLRTFPTLMGYSSRMLAESWESNLLYYAALADEIHAQPAQMNVLVPSWTQQTVEHIFATHLEDWPALLRSLRLVGDDVREKGAQADAGKQFGGDRAVIRRLGFILLVVALAAAQDRPTFRIKVDMVVLSFTITDNKGHYVNGLKPSDFRILEDGIPQKLTTFSEGNKPPVEVAADGTFKPIVVDAAVAGVVPGHRNALGRLRRNQRLRAVRHQQLHVSRLRLRLGCDRRFHPRPGPAPIRWPCTPTAAI